MSGKPFAAIHGHFYQPPRENPWTEEIELQRSAAPFRDWNERIHYECYRPNTQARVLDEEGSITDIVNNCEVIGFNIGPTLLSWIAARHPGTYRRILEADRKSVEAHDGHGNAIAQGYNHMILPLASRRDKVTQVIWGVADFRKRFGREPEAMWLPEIAVNEETLEVLIAAGMKYVILAPTQAEAVRPFDSEHWKDISHGHIDPKHPYRCQLRSDPTKFIDVFFYDGPVSRAVGFDDLLFDAHRFMSSIQSASVAGAPHDQLVLVATDGETFGHHKAYGDRVLAYLTNIEAPARGFKIVNPAEYLALHPPTQVVRIKEGKNGEGTSWSCAHGVARWTDHCGCRGGGPSHWNQHWRKPLRAALDWLSAELAGIFEEKGRAHFRDPWDARNDYIHVVLDRSSESVNSFFARHALRAPDQADMTAALKLLEMQRHAMLMYTSCGWFFTEISGIETVQILQYAARAIELGEDASGRAIEEEFLKRLELAKSNLAELADGRGVWESYVRPSRTDAARVVAHYGLLSIFEDFGNEFRMGCFKLNVLYQRKESYADLVVSFGRIRSFTETTREEGDHLFLVLQFGAFDFRCSVRPWPGASEFERLERTFFEILHSGHVIELMRLMDENIGPNYFELKDIFLAERQEILAALSREAIQKISRTQEEMFDSSRRMSEIYRSINLPIPEEIRYAAAHTLSKRLLTAVEELAEEGFDPRKTQAVQHILDMAKKFDVGLKKTPVASRLTSEISWRTRCLAERPLEADIVKAVNIERLAKRIGVELDKRSAQDDLFAILKSHAEDPAKAAAVPQSVRDLLFQLAAALDMNLRELKTKLATLP